MEKVKLNQKVIYENSFVTIERDLFNKENQKFIKNIPSGDFICIKYKGPYCENYKYFKQLIDYIEYKRIQVEDFIYEIPIIDPLSTNDKDELITEIQVLVKKREIDLRCLV